MNARATGPGAGSRATSSAVTPQVQLEPREREVQPRRDRPGSMPGNRSRSTRVPVRQRLHGHARVAQDLAPEGVERPHPHGAGRPRPAAPAPRPGVPSSSSAARLLNATMQIDPGSRPRPRARPPGRPASSSCRIPPARRTGPGRAARWRPRAGPGRAARGARRRMEWRDAVVMAREAWQPPLHCRSLAGASAHRALARPANRTCPSGVNRRRSAVPGAWPRG